MYSKKRLQFIVDRYRTQNAANKRRLSQKEHRLIGSASKVYRLENRRIDRENISLLDFIAIRCINKNNDNVLKCCFDVGIDPNKIIDDYMDETLLHKAIQAKRIDHKIVKLLLKHRANVNCENTAKKTPIFFAFLEVNKENVHKRIALLRLLIAKGANINHQDSLLNTPLVYLIMNMSSSNVTIDQVKTAVQIYLEAGAKTSLNRRNVMGNTILHLACGTLPHLYKNGHINEYKSFFKLLMTHGAESNIRDSLNQTPLHILLTERKNICLLQVFKKEGADFNSKNKLHQTPLYSYCVILIKQNNLDNRCIDRSLAALIKNGCDINSIAIDKTTVLHIAAAKLNAHICTFLIEAGGDIHARDYLNRTPLHFAATSRLTEVSEVCIRYKSDINTYDIFGYTPLHYAELNENTNVVKLFCNNQANIYAKCKLGFTPIHLAAECGNAEMINVFARMNADLNVRDQWDATPLIYASSEGNLETIRALLKAGADKTLCDQDGKNSFDHALINGQRRVATFLSRNKHEIDLIKRQIFPNEKSIQPSDNAMRKYYRRLIKELKRIRKTTASEVGELILSAPGVGRVDDSSKEIEEIRSAVEKYASAILKRVAQLDPRFEASIYPAGSIVENVKVGYPDEFDFMCVLTKYQHVIECLEYIDEDVGFARAKLFDEYLLDNDDKLQIGNQYLNAHYILRHFKQLALIASHSIDMNEVHPQLSTGLTLSYELLEIFNSAFILRDLPTHGLTWRGKVYKTLEISIDLTPAIFMQEYPPSARIFSDIVNTTMSNHGLYIIPKDSRRLPPPHTSFHAKQLEQAATVWRLSFSHIEKRLFTAINENLKDGYRLAKSFRLLPLSPKLSLPLSPYMNEHLEELIASNQAFRADTSKESTNIHHHIYEDEEIDGLHAIHSYHLKNLFLNYMEECYREKKTHTYQELARILYEKLIECDQQGFLPSYFMPSHNLYYYTYYYDSRYTTKNAMLSFSKYIFKTMKKLNF